MKRAFRWLTMFDVAFATILVGGCLGLLLLPGCQGSGADGAMTVRDGLDFLERGNAVGNFTYTHGGSPLSVGSKQVFFAGPENASASFNGTIDFGKVSATDLLPQTE